MGMNGSRRCVQSDSRIRSDWKVQNVSQTRHQWTRTQHRGQENVRSTGFSWRWQRRRYTIIRWNSLGGKDHQYIDKRWQDCFKIYWPETFKWSTRWYHWGVKVRVTRGRDHTTMNSNLRRLARWEITSMNTNSTTTRRRGGRGWPTATCHPNARCWRWLRRWQFIELLRTRQLKCGWRSYLWRMIGRTRGWVASQREVLW